jgi:hypothetical protein
LGRFCDDPGQGRAIFHASAAKAVSAKMHSAIIFRLVMGEPKEKAARRRLARNGGTACQIATRRNNVHADNAWRGIMTAAEWIPQESEIEEKTAREVLMSDGEVKVAVMLGKPKIGGHWMEVRADGFIGGFIYPTHFRPMRSTLNV